MTVKVLVLNGPPRSGKDTVASYLCQQWPDHMVDLKMSYSLKRACHAVLGFHNVDVEHFNDLKDCELEEFGNRTPRQFYIDMAERFIKTRFGKNWFGYAWMRRYIEESHDQKLAIISDSGFVEELEPLMQCFDNGAMVLVRLHREGHDFQIDSRGYVSNVLSKEFDVMNIEGKPMIMINSVLRVLQQEHVFGEV